MRRHETGAAAASANARRSFGPGRRGKPAMRKASNAYPRSGTSRASTRSGDPANVTSTPRARSASATASDGATWPTVPPAAIRHLNARARSMTTGDVKEDACRQEVDDQARAAIGDEGKRDAGQRRGAQNGGEVDDRLAADEGRRPGGEPFPERVAAADRESQARVREGAVPGRECGEPDEP